MPNMCTNYGISPSKGYTGDAIINCTFVPTIKNNQSPITSIEISEQNFETFLKKLSTTNFSKICPALQRSCGYKLLTHGHKGTINKFL